MPKLASKTLKLSLAIGCALLLTSTGVAQGELKGALRSLLRRKMLEFQIPGLQFAIVRQHGIVDSGVLGYASLQLRVPVTPNTVFPINSITKAFVGVAVMQLVQAGKLDLDAPVSRYLDGLPADWQPISLRRLMTHTSGLPDIWTYGPSPLGSDPAQAWQKVKSRPMDFRPGEKFAYNQTNYALIGMILDKLSGHPFERLIQDRQLRPAQMNHSGFFDGKDVIPNGASIYTVYDMTPRGQVFTAQVKNIPTEDFPHLVRASVSVNTTATDLARWIVALQEGRLLKSKTIDEMWTVGRLNNGRHAAFSRLINGYGIGWPMAIRSKHPALTPTGGGRAAFFWYRNDDLAIVITTNLGGGSPENFMDEIASLYIPDLRTSRGFNLPGDVQSLQVTWKTANIAELEHLVASAPRPVTEQELLQWAYGLLDEPSKIDRALAVFRLAVRLHPSSANAKESLGEGYEAAGNRRLAIRFYRLALELDPKTPDAARRLRRLTSGE